MVPPKELSAVALRLRSWMNPRAFECRRILRVRDLPAPTKRREFSSSPLPDCFDENRVAMIDKILKWSSLSVFFTHEQQRNIRAQEVGRRRRFQRLARDQGTESFSPCAVSN